MNQIKEVNLFTALYKKINNFFWLFDESEMAQAMHSKIMGIALEVRGGVFVT